MIKIIFILLMAFHPSQENLQLTNSHDALYEDAKNYGLIVDC